MIYACMACVALLTIASLAVDFGRVQLVKVELSRAADASARAAAAEMVNGITAAKTAAKDLSHFNAVNEESFRVKNEDIDFGIWDTSTRTFTDLPNTQFSNANAVRIRAARTNAKGTALPLIFGQMIGMDTIDLQVTAIAVMPIASQTASTSVTGRACVWFAGLPNTATAAYGGDITYASSCPAVQFSGFQVTPGATLTFDVTGTLSNVPSGGNNPEGNTGSIQSNLTNQMGGKSNINAPLNSLVAVFIDDSNPTSTAAPPNLNFSSAAARDYTSLQPQLKQVFYIGNGKTSGGAAQQITVPSGATKLFFGSMDPYGWHNNAGTATVNATSAGGPIKLVQ